MKTLLIIAPHAGVAEAVRALVDSTRYRVLYQSVAGEADLMRLPPQFDVCVLDAELTSVKPIRILQAVHRRWPFCPIFVLAAARQWEWEEEAYLLGVSHVLTKPIRAKLLNALLERLEGSQGVAPGEAPHPATVSRTQPRLTESSGPVTERSTQRTLESLRNISSVLAHSLSAEGLLSDFLLQLREILGVNRAAVFLRPPPGAVDIAPDPSEPRLQVSCSIGIAPELLQQLALSLYSGVGGAVARHGRIVRRTDETAMADPATRKEFELFGVEVAVPILDRQSMLGVALFDCRVTGEPLGNEELALIFYLLEGVGMALRNIRLHDQLNARHGLLADILGQFDCACVVVARDMSILHANQTAMDCFGLGGREVSSLEFSDLPQELGSRVFEAIKSGQSAGLFKHHFAHLNNRTFQISITPFRKSAHALPEAVLLLADDCTQDEHLHRLEIEAANLRTVRTMAERLAHEIGNAIVPLSTHQQLFSEKIDDSEFRGSLQAALGDAVKRISRLNQQMLFLAQDRSGMKDAITVSKLIEEAFREAQKHHADTPVYLQYESASQPLSLAGDRAGLRHALAELMLNAVQANPPMPKVKVTTRADTDEAGQKWVHIDVQDSGAGFAPDVAKKVTEPFFTTRNVGLGLGLAVCRKIIETHHGKLKIAEPRAGQSGLVTISLPASSN